MRINFRIQVRFGNDQAKIHWYVRAGSVPVILRRMPKSDEQMTEDDQEGECPRKAELCWRCMRTGLWIRKRNEQWEKLPETVTQEQKKKDRIWSKEDVRVSRKQCLEPVLQLKECYYEFLGECFIHGMMGSEAVAKKSKWKESMEKRNSDR